MAKNRMEEKKSLINKILSRQETSTRDYIVDDYLFPNQWLMGGDSKCFSGANYSYWPVPNGCFFDESIDMGPGGFWEIHPQSLINWDTAIQEYGFGEHNPIIAVIDEGFDNLYYSLSSSFADKVFLISKTKTKLKESLLRKDILTDYNAEVLGIDESFNESRLIEEIFLKAVKNE